MAAEMAPQAVLVAVPVDLLQITVARGATVVMMPLAPLAVRELI